MTAPRRPKLKQPDPWLRTVDRFRKRGWTLPCDCPCHGWPDVREAGPCCDSAGMRYVPGENAYIPWDGES